MADNVILGQYGITQLTGDVIAGPGTGSQAATIAATGDVAFGSVTLPDTGYVQVGTEPAASTGFIRFGDSSIDGDTGGVWGYESGDWGDNIAILRLTLDADDIPQITIGDNDFGRVDFQICNDSATRAIIPNAPFHLGAAATPFGSLFSSSVKFASQFLLEGPDATYGNLSLDASTANLVGPNPNTNLQINASYAGLFTAGEGAIPGAGLYVWNANTNFADSQGYISVITSDAPNAPWVGFNYPLDNTGTNQAAIWGANLVGRSANPYFIWYDGIGANAGVFRVNDLGVMAYYNPTFADYTPGATDFERMTFEWASDVGVIGTEKGGTGTLRALQITGASVAAKDRSGNFVDLIGKFKSTDGSAGVTAGPFTSISSITVKDGIITAITGS